MDERPADAVAAAVPAGPRDLRKGAPEERPLLRQATFLRLWGAGLLNSMVRWTEQLAFAVFVYEQTRSALWVAVLMIVRMLPLTLLGLPYGELAGRGSRHAVLLAMQAALLVSSLALLGLSAAGLLETWHLAVAAGVSGIVWAGDMPVRRSLIGEAVGADRMGQAMALEGVSGNASRLAGPVLGGLLLASGGMTAVQAVSAALYGAATIALLRMRHRYPGGRARAPRPAPGSMLARGLEAVRLSPRLKAVLWLTIVFNVYCWPVLGMVPVIAKESLQLGTRATGLLASMDGVGALASSLLLIALARRLHHGRVYLGGIVAYPLLTPLLALSETPLLSGVTLLLIGVGHSGFAVMQSTLVYVTAPAHRRIEAMGLLTVCIGAAPLGFFLIGGLAEWLGAPGAVLASAGGALATLGLTWRWWRACVQREADAPPPPSPTVA